LADIWRDYLPDAAFVFPDGIERAAADAFRWWELRSFAPRQLRAGVRQAAPRLQRFLEQIQDAFGIAPEATVVGGFSQGAMLALHVGERSRPALAGILAYGGMAAGLPQHRSRVRSAPPVFLYHGTHDAIVPFSAFASTDALLRRLGFDVAEWAAHGIDHTIDREGAELAGKLMQRWLPGAPRPAGPSHPDMAPVRTRRRTSSALAAYR
jgi:phospholipase/carboxylesterase